MAWQNTEDAVRKIASYIWNRSAVAKTIAGVKCDCVLEVEPDHRIIIEITEENSLEKIRTDIAKLRTVKSALMVDEIYAKCYFVMRDKPTDSMRNSGDAQRIEVLSIEEFKNLYFDYPSYVHIRSTRQFGSLIDSETGLPENNIYIKVSYVESKTGLKLGIKEIITRLKAGKKIILKGDFGSGKSRCIKQIFDTINHDTYSDFYSIAINLRDHWGAKRSTEILNRHFDELGLDAQRFMKSFTNPNIIYLLDGFDEIGTQLWSTDVKKMRHTRELSVASLKDIITHATGGVLICGRDYYFNSDKEMLACFGLAENNTIILECHNEFTDAEILEFLKENCSNLIDDKITLPEWLPKRPLVMQLVLKYAKDIFYLENALEDICDFWYEFLNKICERESRINPALNPDTIKQILILLAQKTRVKNQDTGPITLEDLSSAFEEVVGIPPNDESSIMLQRLPTIGRINADSPDRQFLDVFILNGLRAENIIQAQRNSIRSILEEQWENPMDFNGCAILSAYIRKDSKREGVFIALAIQAANHKNNIMASDIISALTLSDETDSIDYKNINIIESHFTNLIFAGKQIRNLYIASSFIDSLDITNASFSQNVTIKDCCIRKVTGISSDKGIPPQIQECDIENFEAIGTVSRIKKAKLSDPQKILVTIIKKEFFQPGRGRKEEALLRGLGTTTSKHYADKILNKLLDEGIITKHKGDEGYIYSPVRKYAQRMDAILTQLTTSQDDVWLYASSL